MNLDKPAPELNDLSLLVLADLAVVPEGNRGHVRIANLLSGIQSVGGKGVPGFVMALQNAGLIEVRRICYKQQQTAWNASITEAGIAFHRDLLAQLKATPTPELRHAA